MVGRLIQWWEVMECTQRWMDVSMESENKMNVGQKGWKSERWEYAGDFLPPQLPGPCYHFSALPKWFCLYTRQGDRERDAEVRLMKRMSFKVLGKSKGSGVVGCHQNFTNSENFLHKIVKRLINFWLVRQRCCCLGHGAFWTHRTRPRPSCHRSRPPGYRLGLRAGRRGGFCSGRVWSEGRGALLRLEKHESSWIHLTKNSLCRKWSEVKWSGDWWSMKKEKKWELMKYLLYVFKGKPCGNSLGRTAHARVFIGVVAAVVLAIADPRLKFA